MSDPQIKQSTPISVVGGRPIYFTAEWIRILNRLTGAATTASGPDNSAVLTDILAQLVQINADLDALRARVERLEEGYQV